MLGKVRLGDSVGIDQKPGYQREISDFEEVQGGQVGADEAEEVDDGVVDRPALVVQTQQLQPLEGTKKDSDKTTCYHFRHS